MVGPPLFFLLAVPIDTGRGNVMICRCSPATSPSVPNAQPRKQTPLIRSIVGAAILTPQPLTKSKED